MKYIEVNELYEKAVKLEAMAMEQLEKLNKIPFREMTKEEYIAWRVWSAILRERTAFKFDIADAKTVEVIECEHCKWFDGKECCERLGLLVGLDLSFFCKNGERR